MKLLIKNIVLVFVAMIAIVSSVSAQSSKYKFMLKMNDYKGKEAYVVLSLVDPKGNYVKTLAVMGDDNKWYNTIKEWYKFHDKSKVNIDAITGASMKPDDRAVKTIDIDDAKLDAGYKLRFESAVEHGKYHTIDVEIPVDRTSLNGGNFNGNGYVKFVKINKI